MLYQIYIWLHQSQSNNFPQTLLQKLGSEHYEFYRLYSSKYQTILFFFYIRNIYYLILFQVNLIFLILYINLLIFLYGKAYGINALIMGLCLLAIFQNFNINLFLTRVIILINESINVWGQDVRVNFLLTILINL